MISTRGRYAIRVMLELAERKGEGFVPLKDIAERQELSKKYLEIIVKGLVDGGLVRAASGKGGGYMLSRGADEYSVGEILELMEGTLSSVACLGKDAFVCPRANICKTLPIWEEYDRMTRDFFYSKKLSDLL